ncbi:hypothetical protein V1478_017328 [Vespula squamosa]|uniref:Maturase K n=1 Tax=Vespula squamosa TaxID=30214 RepID=A0ABD2A099_VESSQ
MLAVYRKEGKKLWEGKLERRSGRKKAETAMIYNMTINLLVYTSVIFKPNFNGESRVDEEDAYEEASRSSYLPYFLSNRNKIFLDSLAALFLKVNSVSNSLHEILLSIDKIISFEPNRMVHDQDRRSSKLSARSITDIIEQSSSIHLPGNWIPLLPSDKTFKPFEHLITLSKGKVKGSIHEHREHRVWQKVPRALPVCSARSNGERAARNSDEQIANVVQVDQKRGEWAGSPAAITPACLHATRGLDSLRRLRRFPRTPAILWTRCYHLQSVS